jgi:hypothetical protein
MLPGLGGEDEDPKKLPERMGWMFKLYGRHPGETCKTCAHLVRDHYRDKNYLKCNMTRQTRGPGTDWRAGWPACGRWEKAE